MFGFWKKLLRRWFRNFLAFLAMSYFYDGFSVFGGINNVILAAVVMTIVETFFQPLLKMLLVPVNIITFGMFSWLLTTLELLIVVYMVKSVEFVAFSFDSFELFGFEIGAMSVNMFFSVIMGTIFFNFLTKLIKKLSVAEGE